MMKKYLIIILCLTATVFGINKRYLRPQVNTVGLVAHYKLWAGLMVTGKIFDYSLSGKVGTLVDASDPITLVPMYPGFDFVDNNDYITFGDNPIWATTGYSISIWVKGSSQSGKVIYSDGSSASANPLLFVATGSIDQAKVRIVIRNDAAATQLVAETTTTAFDDTWHHIGITDSNGTMLVYIDGVIDATDFSYTPSTLTLNLAGIGVGMRATPTNFFTGTIGDVMIFDVVKTATEIKSIYEVTRLRYSK